MRSKKNKKNKKNPKKMDLNIVKSYIVFLMALTGMVVSVLMIYIYPPYSFDIASDIKFHTQLTITSPEFSNNSYIPQRYTCYGAGINPALEISNIPDNTESLVLLLEQPNNNKETVSHWVVANINPLTTLIHEGESPIGSTIGMNSNNSNSYLPPCPDSGEQKYIYKIYALSISPEIHENITQPKLIGMIKDFIIEQNQLIFYYKKP